METLPPGLELDHLPTFDYIMNPDGGCRALYLKLPNSGMVTI